MVENLIVILFLCAAVPMVPAVYIVKDRKYKIFLGYMLLGMTICLIASMINNWFLGLFGGDLRYVSTNVTPVVEEVLKALPVLYFALLFSDDRDMLLSISFVLGLGFAMLENMFIMVENIDNVTILWAIVRGFGAAYMHSVCTCLIGIGISYVYKRRKLFICGTISLLILAIILHGLFNTLIQSQYKPAAYGVVLVIHIPRMIAIVRQILSRRKARQL